MLAMDKALEVIGSVGRGEARAFINGSTPAVDGRRRFAARARRSSPRAGAGTQRNRDLAGFDAEFC
jgi:hypothetical protein